MKFKDYFKEEFHNGYKVDGKYVEVYKTPLKYDDIRSLNKLKALRFCADFEHDVLYFWDANTLHYSMAPELNLRYSQFFKKDDPLLLWGEAQIGSGIQYFHSSFEVNFKESFDDKKERVGVVEFLTRLSKKDGKQIYSTLSGLKAALRPWVKKAEKFKNAKKQLLEVIEKEGSLYVLYSKKIDPKTGKRRVLGRASTLEEIKKREQQVQFFKRLKK